MDAQMLMLYILILINQVIAYGALIYLATSSGKGKRFAEGKSQDKKEKSPKKQVSGEEPADKSGKYIDYINKFEVEA